ncbi:hypothetical protein CIPAW_10G097000 [Carya illinoinensis]|uniref:Disease resistance protein At4g27190-like leucine-rich repeats domain-containing protein n=1 Tax=Carya illinoinensis TaxID=32201 RepID=A0A8T1P4D6_CARIL|nr:hypothetical protein CIPAW_10G097000 [Carya illinoinensis]
MHDLVHDLVLSIIHEEWSEIDADNKEIAPTVRHLSVSDNGQQVSKSLNKLTSVRTIIYRTKPHMDRCLTNLRMLVFLKCESLTSLPPIIKHLTALESLYIAYCKEIDLTEGGEGDAQDLDLRLQILGIKWLPKLEVLPERLLGSANTLKHLDIEACENLKALPEWLSTLKSLQTLEIIDCKELSSLPEGIHHIKALRKLKIEDCPQLVTRSEDWSNIPGLEVLVSENAKDDEED